MCIVTVGFSLPRFQTSTEEVSSLKHASREPPGSKGPGPPKARASIHGVCRRESRSHNETVPLALLYANKSLFELKPRNPGRCSKAHSLRVTSQTQSSVFRVVMAR